MKTHILKISIVSGLMALLTLSGCYKKDLDNFNEAGGVRLSPEIALPFLIADISLKDTIPKLPFFTYVRMTDTASVEIPEGPESDSAEAVLDYIEFKILFENAFPFSGTIQLYFADESGAFIDSLLSSSERIVVAGNITTPVKSELIIYVDKARYKEITTGATDMFLYYDLTTNDISGLENAYLRTKIGIKSKININL
jgi:hypothetical protein